MKFHFNGQKKLQKLPEHGIINSVERESEMSRGSNSDAQAVTGARTDDSLSTGMVPSDSVSTEGHPNTPSYQVQDADGAVKTYFETHPGGNRKQRRYRSRHHPYFTKKRTGGRDWELIVRERSREQSSQHKH